MVCGDGMWGVYIYTGSRIDYDYGTIIVGETRCHRF